MCTGRQPHCPAGWQTLFDFGNGQVKNNKKIDTTISSVMFTLPPGPHRWSSHSATFCASSVGATRRPSIAAAMGVDVLHRNDLGDIAGVYRLYGMWPGRGRSRSAGSQLH